MSQHMLTGMEATLELAGNAASNDPDIGLRAVAALRVLTEQLEILQVDNARALGWSWEKIARQLGGRRWVRRRVRRARRARWAAAPAGGGTRAAGPPGVPAAGEGTGAGPRRVPFTPRARKCLMHA